MDHEFRAKLLWEYFYKELWLCHQNNSQLFKCKNHSVAADTGFPEGDCQMLGCSSVYLHVFVTIQRIFYSRLRTFPLVLTKCTVLRTDPRLSWKRDHGECSRGQQGRALVVLQSSPFGPRSETCRHFGKSFSRAEVWILRTSLGDDQVILESTASPSQ